jgi:multicomponent Na+:H+ antiporter subunit E
VGVGAVAVAVVASLALLPPAAGRPRPRAVLALVGFFLRTAVLGGVDVARRALARTPPTDGWWHRHELRLPPDRGRLLFVAMIGLLPGTVTGACEPDGLLVHVLAADLDPALTLDALERHVAAALGVEIDGERP